jgi:signal transduction histidine kinase/CheY-like chemotaxis protein
MRLLWSQRRDKQVPLSILSIAIRNEHDTVDARQRARQIARMLGFDTQDQTRISTAVSEIARNAFNYARGGKVEFFVEGQTAPQLFIIRIADNGPGIRDVKAILEGRYESSTGMGLGITGARRLMDQFQIDSAPGGGTTVVMKKLLPRRADVIRQADLGRIADSLEHDRPRDALTELQYQNQELMRALEEIQNRQTELRRLNQELEDTNRGVVSLYAELEDNADHLRRADELKSKFLSNMSHEFRSPLNSILALSGLLLDRSDGDLTGEQNQQVGYIRRAASDLLELVNDLLDLAKVEAGKVDIKPVEFEVDKLFGSLRGMLRPLLLNQQVDLVFEEVNQLPQMYADEGKISQILRNFISNALKFTEKGEVRVSAELAGENLIRFSVSDTGIGIAPEDQEAIFQDFVQLDHPIQKRVKGTGLGLPLSKKLATLMAGRVDVRSQPGAGSTFSLLLPVTWHEFAAGEPVAQPDWAADPASVPVLVVEDSPEMVMTYRSYLKGSGFQPLFAATAREAEESLDKTRPAAIVLDLVLRSEDTWGLMAKLKGEAATKDIPILVVSTTADQAKAFHLGADGYLVKPVGRSVLLSDLQALTGETRGCRVLIVDDNELDRYLLKQHLQKLPAVVTEAADAADGIRKACELRPEAIFLDLAMPGMTGFEALDRLKAEEASKDIPVVIVSSRALSAAERERLLEKAAAILAKGDLDKSDITDLVRRILNTPSLTLTAGRNAG